MKKSIVLTILVISVSLVFLSFAKATRSTVVLADTAKSTAVPDTNVSESIADAARIVSNSIYDHLNLDERGLSHEAVDLAVKGYQKLIDEGAVTNDEYLTIVDLSQSSRKKRFYIIDMKKDSL